MNSYEILILTKGADMEFVQQALHNAEIDEDGDGTGLYLQDGKPHSVFIQLTTAGDIARAVKIINGLGYETDEDEPEDIDATE